MEYIFTLSLIVIILQSIMIYILIDNQKTIIKLIKAENLGEFEIYYNKENKENNDVQNERFIDINNLSEKEIEKININPEKIYGGYIGTKKIKKEIF